MYFYIFGRKINYIVIKQSTKQKIRKIKKKKEKDNNVDTRSQDCVFNEFSPPLLMY